MQSDGEGRAVAGGSGSRTGRRLIFHPPPQTLAASGFCTPGGLQLSLACGSQSCWVAPLFPGRTDGCATGGYSTGRAFPSTEMQAQSLDKHVVLLA